MQAPTHFAGGLISDLIPPIEQIACPIASHKGRLADSQWGAALLATTVCRVSHNSENIRLAGKAINMARVWQFILVWAGLKNRAVHRGRTVKWEVTFIPDS